MERSLTIPVGVVLAREPIDNPWLDHIWRPVSVLLHAPPVSEWRLLRRAGSIEHHHAATLPLELHAKETGGYIANLASGEPAVFVILREAMGSGSGAPVEVHAVTASAWEVQAYEASSEQTIHQVAMPEALVELIEAFIAAHHSEEPFRKRQRDRTGRREDEAPQFGQEPISELRRRLRRRDPERPA